MTKLMRSHGVGFETSPPDRTRDNLANVTASLQTVEGRTGTQEHPAAGQFRSTGLKIGCDRLSNVMGQRQRSFHTAFPVHAQTTFAPVDIAQFEPDDLSSTEPESGQQQQDGSIAQSSRRSPCLARAQENLDTVCRHRPRNRRHRPSGDRRHCRRKIAMDVAAIPCEAEERPQRRNGVLCGSKCARLRRILPEVVHNLAGVHRGEFQIVLARYVLTESD